MDRSGYARNRASGCGVVVPLCDAMGCGASGMGAAQPAAFSLMPGSQLLCDRQSARFVENGGLVSEFQRPLVGKFPGKASRCQTDSTVLKLWGRRLGVRRNRVASVCIRCLFVVLFRAVESSELVAGRERSKRSRRAGVEWEGGIVREKSASEVSVGREQGLL